MTLTLRIENFDSLENGGPVELVLAGRGASVGRRNANDWVLPDPDRHISGHHFDITYADGAYFLVDVSTNGTFLQGQNHRLDGPYRIRDGDRFAVGHYMIVARLPPQAQAPAPRPVAAQAPPTAFGAAIPPHPQPPAPEAPPIAASPAPVEDDPWDLGGLGEPAGGGQSGLQRPPLSQGPSGLQTPAPPAAGRPATQFPPSPPSGPPPGLSRAPMGQAPAAPEAGFDGASMPPVSDQTPADLPMPTPREATPHAPAPMPEPSAMPVPPRMPRAAPPAAAVGAAPEADAVFRAFCEGAGLDPAAYRDADAVALARQLGEVVRISTREIVSMLHDRAAVKHFTRGGERTMQSATGNNPMKFLPDPEQAIEAMFLKSRQGFMNGPQAFANALGDVRQHQKAVFAALQPALAHVLAGMSPDEIEAEAGGGLLGGGARAKAWERYVELWDAKAATGDNGMLDVFLQAFAETYARALGGRD